MEEKRQDLDSEKQKKLLERLVSELSREHIDFYYRPTSDIAFAIEKHIKETASLNQEERALLDRLAPRDIQILLSLH
ncbi:MAG: hypothetical protein HRU11_00340 [Parvularculaceae bacterium]|nr:hypothetical protein [Parvularculaceae bacterium]